MAETVIQVRDLTKFYGRARALGPVSFHIDRGEVVGLLGLNGAGKTTTLRVLACDLLPSSGSVEVAGLDVVDRPHEVRGRIGYLPDTPPLYGDMSVGEFLAFAARLRGVPKAELGARVREALDATELGGVEHQVIASLSHGYKQRAGIAQAIVHKPDLLILDEPISGLDPRQIVEMRALIRGLRGKHTIVVSSHILSEISETCDRILVIREGQIAAQGTEEELSRAWLQGMRIEVSVRGDASRAAEVLGAVPGVVSCEEVEVAASADAPSTFRSEPSHAATLRVSADRDVREDVARALVGAGLGLLELRRGERELESVFLRLASSASPSGPGEGGEAPRKAGRKDRSEKASTATEGT